MPSATTSGPAGSGGGTGGGGADAVRWGSGGEVRAAGAVVWRPGPAGAGPELLVVHRPKYDDWSFAKGKAEKGEDPAETARREVREETGLAVALGARLPDTAYVIADGRRKRVLWWAGRAEGDGRAAPFTPNDEVDAAVWLAAGEARARLTQPRDRELVDALLGAV